MLGHAMGVQQAAAVIGWRSAAAALDELEASEEHLSTCAAACSHLLATLLPVNS